MKSLSQLTLSTERIIKMPPKISKYESPVNDQSQMPQARAVGKQSPIRERRTNAPQKGAQPLAGSTGRYGALYGKRHGPPQPKPKSPRPLRIPETTKHKPTFGKPAIVKPEIHRRPALIKRVIGSVLKVLKKLIGHRCCIFWLLLSIWGTIQLAIMAVLFYIKSVALLEQPLKEHDPVVIKQFDSILNHLAWAGCRNCIVAAIIYFLCGLAAYFRIQVIKRREARKPAPEAYLRRHPSYMIYDIGTRSNNKIGPQPLWY